MGTGDIEPRVVGIVVVIVVFGPSACIHTVSWSRDGAHGRRLEQRGKWIYPAHVAHPTIHQFRPPIQTTQSI